MAINKILGELFARKSASDKNEDVKSEVRSEEENFFEPKPSKENIIAGEVFEAVKGLGTDEQTLQEVLIGISQEEGEKISNYHRTSDGKSIIDVIKADTSGKLQKRLLAALRGEMEINEDDAPESMSVDAAREAAKKLYEAVNDSTWYSFGFGTDEETIWETLKDLSGEQIAYIEQVYELVYDENLKKRLDRELSGNDQKKLDEIYKNAITQILINEPTEATNNIDNNDQLSNKEINDGYLDENFDYSDYLTPEETKELLSTASSFKELYENGILSDDDIEYFSGVFDKDQLNKAVEVLNTQNIAALMKDSFDFGIYSVLDICELEEADFKYAIEIIDSALFTTLVENGSDLVGMLAGQIFRSASGFGGEFGGETHEIQPPSKELLSNLFNNENFISYLTDENNEISNRKTIELFDIVATRPELFETLVEVFNNEENREFFEKANSYTYDISSLMMMNNNSLIEDREPVVNEIQDFLNKSEIDLDIKVSDFQTCTNDEIKNILECLNALQTCEFSYFMKDYNLNSLIMLKDANSDYFKELTTQQSLVMHKVLASNEYGVISGAMFMYGEEEFDLINKILYGDPVDPSLVEKLSEFEEKYGVSVRPQNNISLDSNNKDASIYITQEWMDIVGSTLQSMKEKGISLPEEIFLVEFCDNSASSGCFLSSRPNAIAINVDMAHDEKNLQAIVIHETGHLNDYSNNNAFASDINAEFVGISANELEEKIKVMNFEMNGKDVSLTNDDISGLVREYATTNVHEFVAEVSTLFGMEAIYKDENGKYQIDKSKAATSYIPKWSGTEEDYETLEKIIAAYDILTQGSKNTYRG